MIHRSNKKSSRNRKRKKLIITKVKVYLFSHLLPLLWSSFNLS